MGPFKSTGGAHEASKKVLALKSEDEPKDFYTQFSSGLTKSLVSK